MNSSLQTGLLVRLTVLGKGAFPLPGGPPSIREHSPPVEPCCEAGAASHKPLNTSRRLQIAFHTEAYRKLRSKIRSQTRAFAIERQASLVGAICSW
jgi:hypothetical protein